jgi:hypothetical protein
MKCLAHLLPFLAELPRKRVKSPNENASKEAQGRGEGGRSHRNGPDCAAANAAHEPLEIGRVHRQTALFPTVVKILVGTRRLGGGAELARVYLRPVLQLEEVRRHLSISLSNVMMESPSSS